MGGVTLVRPPSPSRYPDALPRWAAWRTSRPYTVGIEEEVMILDRATGALAGGDPLQLDALPGRLAGHVRAETHRAVAELATSPHTDAGGAAQEAARLREELRRYLAAHGWAAATAGTHPTVQREQVEVSEAGRYRVIQETMRALARREPTFALHVHVGVEEPERAVQLANRLRVHVPLLLALSANSPFWQGRDSGLSSARIPIFGAFPRVGIPRAFGDYPDYVEAVDRLVRTGAIPEPTFLWWDVRLQPALGTVELRVMDAQLTSSATAALLALTQALAHLELESGLPAGPMVCAAEVLDENRFLAARDGMAARLIDLERDELVPVTELLAHTLDRVREHAEELGCAAALEGVRELAREPGAAWQRSVAARDGLPGLLQRLIGRFTRG